jgi:cytochrome c biogenesis protein CcmG, thiol:disulfide interchange protein DsbE
MKFIKDHYIVVTLVLTGLWIAVTAFLLPPGTEQLVNAAPRQGFKAPDFELQSLTGGSVRLSDLEGQAVLLNFWASWCAPCQAEMPAFQEVHETYSEDEFIVLAVNMTAQDNLSDVNQFVDKHGLTFTILLDEFNEVGRQYTVRALPSTYFISKEGIITEVVVGGPLPEALLHARVADLLDTEVR